MEWKPKPLAEKLKIKALQNNIGVPFEIANLLVQRGIEDFDSAKVFSTRYYRLAQSLFNVRNGVSSRKDISCYNKSRKLWYMETMMWMVLL